MSIELVHRARLKNGKIKQFIELRKGDVFTIIAAGEQDTIDHTVYKAASDGYRTDDGTASVSADIYVPWYSHLPKHAYKWMQIYWLTFKLAINQLNEIHLGDHVIHEDKVWSVSNGVSRPSWALVTGNPEDGTHEYKEYVHEDDFRVVRGIGTLCFRFSSTWNFYKNAWWRIWYNSPREEWQGPGVGPAPKD